jgi:formate hydrogenlyase transcriptional activator
METELTTIHTKAAEAIWALENNAPPEQTVNGHRQPWRLPVQIDATAGSDSTGDLRSNFRARQAYEFEGLLMDILARFVNLPAGEVDREMEDALGRICEFLGVERAGLWHEGEGSGSFVLAHHCMPSRRRVTATAREKVQMVDARPCKAPNNSRIPLGNESNTCCPWIAAQVKRGKTVTFSKITDLPDEAAQDKAGLSRLGMQASIFIPLLVMGEVRGLVHFEMPNEERTWPELLVRRLEFAAEVFAHAASRTLSDEKLHESETRFRTMADSAPVLLWMSGLDKLCDFFNKPWLDFTGRRWEQELGNGWIEGVHADDREPCMQTYATAFDAREAFSMQYRLRRHDGEYRWILDNGVPRYDPQGNFAGYIGSGIDITERKIAEEALTKSYAEIKQLKDRLQTESDYLKAEIRVTHAHGEIIGRSQGIRRVLHQAEQVAPADCSVLISGETGTGKELIAEHIHHLSTRKERVMVLVNCAALPTALVESELFGRERGAYTGALTSQVGRFEVANGSTIFLDEVGELSMEVQAKLLRVLQQGEYQRLGSPKTHRVDVRVIAATNRDLAEEVRKGRFREDLYYRLKVFPIEIPPLRERLDDIPLLVFAFMEEFATRMGKKITKIPRKAMEVLQGHSWPGNIRELRNVIEHGVILTSGDTLKLTVLGDSPTREAQPVTLAEAEREHILKMLESTGWRIKGPHGAATKLDLQPSTLYSRMQKLGIPHRRQKDEISTNGLKPRPS